MSFKGRQRRCEADTRCISRWIRLLFGRELEFDHMLILWDQLFANDFSQETVDMICVVMILILRWQCKLSSFDGLDVAER